MAGLDSVVWVADGRVTGALDYGDRLVERLAGRGLQVARRDLTSPGGPIPRARLHVLSGGATSVNDRSTWMSRGLDLVASLVEGAGRGEHSVVGVCLGSQMIAETLWPGSTRAASKIEVGLAEVRWWDGDSGGDGERIIVPAFHYEELDLALIKEPGQVIADNGHSPVQGFRYGSRVWGFQFHPEFDPADMRRIVLHNQRTIESRHGSTQAALSSVDRLAPRWTPAVFDRLLHEALQG